MIPDYVILLVIVSLTSFISSSDNPQKATNILRGILFLLSFWLLGANFISCFNPVVEQTFDYPVIELSGRKVIIENHTKILAVDNLDVDPFCYVRKITYKRSYLGVITNKKIRYQAQNDLIQFTGSRQ